jgi:hypothetical protein
LVQGYIAFDHDERISPLGILVGACKVSKLIKLSYQAMDQTVTRKHQLTFLRSVNIIRSLTTDVA